MVVVGDANEDEPNKYFTRNRIVVTLSDNGSSWCNLCGHFTYCLYTFDLSICYFIFSVFVFFLFRLPLLVIWLGRARRGCSYHLRGTRWSTTPSQVRPVRPHRWRSTPVLTMYRVRRCITPVKSSAIKLRSWHRSITTRTLGIVSEL